MNKGVEPFIVLGINWLIPGAGFIVKKRIYHGLILFFILNITFLIGFMLHGGVVWPTFDRSSSSFNLVNILTFIGQLGNGGMSLFSLAQQKIGWELFKFTPEDPLSDLGALYFLISGAMNYFATCNLYDRFYKPASRTDANV